MSQVDISGHGHHMGMDVVWQYKLRPDGAFLETISGKEMKFRWGCDGVADGSCWEVTCTFCCLPKPSTLPFTPVQVDDTDVPKPLQLDDNEVSSCRHKSTTRCAKVAL